MDLLRRCTAVMAVRWQDEKAPTSLASHWRLQSSELARMSSLHFRRVFLHPIMQLSFEAQFSVHVLKIHRQGGTVHTRLNRPVFIIARIQCIAKHIKAIVLTIEKT